jgi:hypothetical protein
MPAEIEARVVELRRVHRHWEPWRIGQEITRRGLLPVGRCPSESGIYRCLVRAGLGEPLPRHRRERFER